MGPRPAGGGGDLAPEAAHGPGRGGDDGPLLAGGDGDGGGGDVLRGAHLTFFTGTMARAATTMQMKAAM